MSMQRLSFLLIGVGLGVTIGEENKFIILFGIFILSSGFILNVLNERDRMRRQFNE